MAIGHVTNEKLKRMLSLNGAKQELLNIVLRLERQICKQVAPPQAAPIAAFHRPISINDRVVADPFFVWDESGEKFVVAHLLDAFALYQIAVARIPMRRRPW